MTRRTIPGQNPGKPTAEAIADALIQHETGGCCRFGETCGLCDCAREGATPEQLETRDAMELDRARAVLALIPPQRCAPSEDEVAQTVLAHTPTSWRSFANDSLLLRCCGRDYGTPVRNLKRGEDGGAHAGYAAHLAEVIAKLYADQPTVAQAKAEEALLLTGHEDKGRGFDQLLMRQLADPEVRASYVAAQLRRIKAEALREAADEIAAVAKRIRDAHGGAPSDVVGHILGGYGQAEGVIRDRADAIESGAEHG